MIDISVIVVNYNTSELVCCCVRSILIQTGISFEILVIDNASSDGSVEALKNNFAAQVQVLESKENLGFGKANNLAAKQARGEYLFLLNPDAILTSPQDLKNLFEFMQQNSKIGLAGMPIYEPRKSNWVHAKMFYPDQKLLRYTKTLENLPGKIAWVLGAAMIVPRNIYEQINGFDASFFLYGDETDLCLRIRKAGYEIGFCELVKIEHVSGASEFHEVPKATWIRKQIGFYNFIQKHYDPRDVKIIAETAYKQAQRKLILLKLQALFKNVDAKIQRAEAVLEISRKHF